MANQPYRDDPEASGSYDDENRSVKNVPANAYFSRTIKILTGLISLESIGLIALLIFICIFVKENDDIPDGWQVSDLQAGPRDLIIIYVINFLLSVPTIFVSVPIIFTVAKDIAFSVVVLVFSARLLGERWPSTSGMCYRWDPVPLPGERWGHQLPPTPECEKAFHQVQIQYAVAAGCGILLGCLILTTLFLRVLALYRVLMVSKFWEGTKNTFKTGGWKPRGFTVQFTLSVLPAQEPASTSEQARLVET